MSAEDLARLDGLHKGFRTRYLRHADLDAQTLGWCEAFPSLARRESIAKSPEGRDLWLLTIGPEPDRARPSVWVDGNMHASELAGSSVALAIAEDALRLHLDPESTPRGMSAVAAAKLREVRFYVLPRMAPDGAEAVLTDGRYVRSNPREHVAKRSARWRGCDVDGDGRAMVMRVEDPGGEFVAAAEFPGLLVPRRIDDPGPYFKVYPEGVIEGFDGDHVPTPTYLSDNDTDLNRNFPWSWRPEPEQLGAGPYPTSEPEARAVVEFMVRHPEVFAWLNLHTFGGVFIRPLGDQPDAKMNPDDLAIWRQIAQWNEQCTGYPTVSGFEDFLYEPDKPLHGDLTDFGYHQRGALAYVCELWDLFKQLGLPKRKPFVDHYSQLTRDDLIALARWDEAHNASRIVRPWKPFNHPQLGWVEVGGLDPRVGVWNPPNDLLGGVCADQSSAFMRVASLAPEVKVDKLTVTAVSEGVWHVTATVQNHGYLPSCGLASAKELPWNEPLVAELRAEGCTVIAPTEARRVIGHLDGWGRGLYGGSLFYLRSRGNTGTRVVEWVVQGKGSVTVSVWGPRVGKAEKSAAVG